MAMWEDADLLELRQVGMYGEAVQFVFPRCRLCDLRFLRQRGIWRGRGGLRGEGLSLQGTMLQSMSHLGKSQ
jgi:hypothetical protein